ncbi:MAG: hypothetical protein JWM05_1905 [Acidimicrobiales bacterium]|nr:hypothetical protein [Acidimicrobiales bacterium]
MTTAEAAERLGVKAETLYAYVSRGLIDRQRGPAGSTFAADDVDRLAKAGRRGRDLPQLVFPSALTRIADGHLAYRGVDAVAAARERSFEEVAEWLWAGAWPAATDWPLDQVVLGHVRTAQAPLPGTCLPLDRFRVVTAVAASLDDLRADLTPDVAVHTARRLVRLLVHALPMVDGRRRDRPGASIAEVLWTRLTRLPPTPGRVAVLDAALVLLADHELATSTLAVRAAAMVRADPYEVIGTGLNVSGGARHGGASLILEPLLRDALEVGVGPALGERFRRGEALAGFGHPLYPHGDPRARPLLDRLDDLGPRPERRRVLDDLLAATAARGVPTPNVDVALAAIAFCAEMRTGAGEAIFVTARTAGWIAHALEQYGQPDFMRVRADYVGPMGG